MSGMQENVFKVRLCGRRLSKIRIWVKLLSLDLGILSKKEMKIGCLESLLLGMIYRRRG